MRRWYGDMVADRLHCPPLEEACEQAGVAMVRVGSFADSAARDHFRDLNLDIGLSLGNGILPAEFFRIPRFGMLNVHHELLPEYRGAQTALWQLHDGSRITGYSVHSITERLDAGCILLREEVPIQWGRTLRDTVIETTADVQLRSVAGLLRLLADYATYRERAMANTGRRVYTTPSARAMLRIYRNFLRLRRASADAAA
jgi:methionyl-tRNA formyltransferase